MPTPLRMKSPIAAWIVRERKRLGLKPKDVADRLAAMGLDVSDQTVKVWESNGNRRPNPFNLEGLERLFGSAAPVEQGLPDQAELVRAISDLVEELRLSRQRQETFDEQILELLAAVTGTPRGRAGSPADTEPATPAGTQR